MRESRPNTSSRADSKKKKSELIAELALLRRLANVQPPGAGKPESESATVLAASANSWSETIRRMPFPGILSRFEDGTILAVTDVFTAVTGYGVTDVLNRTSIGLGILEATVRGDVVNALRQRAGAVRGIETTIGTRSGEKRTVLLSANRIRIGDEDCLFVVLEDVTERRRDEEQLRVQSTLLDHVSDAIIATDNRYIVTRWNRAAEDLYGWRAEEVIGRSTADVLRTEYADCTREEARFALRTRGTWRGLVTQTCRDGSAVRAIASIALLRDDAGIATGSVAVHTDITARMRVEEALRRSEERFLKAFRASPALLTITGLTDGRFIDANESFCALFGYTREELIGRSTAELRMYAREDDRDGIVRHLRSRRSMRNQETVLRTKSGELCTLLWSTEVMEIDGESLMLNTALDITDRKRIEHELEKSEERFAKAFRSNPVALSITRRDGGAFVDVNDSFVRLFGYARRELLGRTAFELGMHPESMRDDLDRRLRERGYVRDLLAAARTRAGEVRDILYSMGAIELDGEPHLLSIAYDVTERLRAEREVRRLNDELERRVRERTEEVTASNRELEAFAYSVSHDLRAPLRAIDGFTHLLEESLGAALDAEATRLFSVIRANARQMDALITDLLTLSKISRADLAPRRVDMRALAESAFDEVAPDRTRRGIALDVGPLPEATGDPVLLRQVWVNLLANAVKYTGLRPVPRIEITAKADDGELVYSVRDNGVGFDPAYAHKLFGIFQRLHRNEEFEGTGVGLAIVERIVRRHRGRVWADGRVDGGATFSFSLPQPESDRA